MQLNGSVANDFQLNGGGPFRIVNQAYNAVLLGIENTGAATFNATSTVAGAFISSGTTPYWYFQSSGAGGSTAYLGFGSSLTSGAASTDFIIRSENALAFNTNGNNERMRITSGGNVGIGTSNPSYLLDVNGTGRFEGNLIAAGVGFIGVIAAYSNNFISFSHTARSGVGEYSFLSANDGGTIINAKSGADIFYRINNSDIAIMKSNGNVGIGTSNPTTYSLAGRHLELNDAGGGYSFYHNNSTSVKSFWAANEASGVIAFFTFSNHALTLGTNNTERLRITPGGNVGINTSSPSYTLDVNGTARFGSAIVANLGTGLVYSNGGTLTSTNPSDQRLKNTIKPLSYGLNEILQLNPKTFYYNDDVNKERLKYGFIAQEVKGIMPELARKLNAETDYLGLETEGIYVTLVNAIKELKQELDTLKNK